MGKSCLLGNNMSIFNFSYVPFRFLRRDFSSDCNSSWLLLVFYILSAKVTSFP